MKILNNFKKIGYYKNNLFFYGVIFLKDKNILNKVRDVYFKYLTFFIVGSFLGCVFETILASIKKGNFMFRRSLIYTPLLPVYGAGIVLSVLLLEKYRKKDKKFIIFILGALICGVSEYIFSFIQENLFHTYSWYYSNVPLNIQGRTSIIHALFWGFLIFLFMQLVYPLVMKLIEITSNKLKFRLIIIITIILVGDSIISGLACMREYERYKNIPANSKLDIFLDEHYTDKFLKNIYQNKKYKK